MQMKTTYAGICLIVLFCTLTPVAGARQKAGSSDTPKGPFEPTWESLKKNYRIPRWFQDGKFGIFIHWGLYAIPAYRSEWYARHMYSDREVHVTPWKQDVESLDRLGLMESLPAGDSEKDVDGRRWEQRLELMRDAIIYNRNNPSVIFYESGNKGVSEEHQRK